jgi:hypothetical protein
MAFIKEIDLEWFEIDIQLMQMVCYGRLRINQLGGWIGFAKQKRLIFERCIGRQTLHVCLRSPSFSEENWKVMLYLRSPSPSLQV